MISGKPIPIVGIPFDEKSSFLRGAAQGPGRLRTVLNDGSSNFFTESGFEISEGVHFQDAGDLIIHSYPDDIQQGISSHLKDSARVVSIGGDHSIVLPIMRAFKKVHDSITILQLDAHTDLYDEFEGDRYSHACPFARIMEESLAVRLVQVGIRVVTHHHQEQQERFGVEMVTMKDWTNEVRPALSGPVYLSLDLDVFDPAFAPGVSHHEPGGMIPRDWLNWFTQLDVELVGADIVELNPTRDSNDITAALAAKLLKEIIAVMWRNKH